MAVKMKIRFQFSLLTLLLLSIVCGVGMTWWYGRYQRWALDLADPVKRNEALFNLLQAQRYHGTPNYKEKPDDDKSKCVVNHVVVSKLDNGSPVYAVFKAHDSRSIDDSGPGLAKGHLILIDSYGYILPFHSGANIVSAGTIADAGANERQQCIDYIAYSLSNGGTATVLHVIPIDSEQIPLLLVAYNRGDEDVVQWFFKVENDHGNIEIQFGPKTDPASDAITPVVRYTWSRTQHRYIGPEGGPDQHVMRLDPEKQSEQMNQYYEGKSRSK